MVCPKAITDGIDTTIASSKIDKRGEIFLVRSEAITAEVGTTSVSSVIDKIGEGFPMRS